MIQQIQDLQAQHPQEAALLQTIVATAAKNVETQLGDLPGEKKRELAQREAVDLLKKAYDGADLFFNFHPAVDYLAKEALIPLIPDMLDTVVNWFNSLGEFTKGAGGVQ